MISTQTLKALLTLPVVAAALLLPAGAEEQHGPSLFGDPKYKRGFARFDYVNPSAQKGGSVSLSAFGRFDSFNPFIIKGSVAANVSLIYDTLTKSSLNEPGSQYGLVAETVSHAADYSGVSVRLNPTAQFHDGHIIDAEDVIWTFDALTDKTTRSTRPIMLM